MIIFIVAPPRSGTSFLYNHLCYSLKIDYPTNLLKIFKKNYFFGFRIQNFFLKFVKKKLNLNSYYGYTKGLLSPSEFGFFFRDQLNIHNNELFKKIEKKRLQILIQNINRIKSNKKNIIFKNFYTIKEINYISNKYKYCRWIFIKRERKNVINSFFKMRKELKNKQRPIIYIKNYSDSRAMVKRNINLMEKLIKVAMLKMPKKNFIVVNFNKLITNPTYEILKIKKKFNIKC